MLLLSSPAAEGGKRGAPLGDDEASRTAKKQKTVRAMAKSETAAKSRGKEVGKPPQTLPRRTVTNALASFLHEGRMQ